MMQVAKSYMGELVHKSMVQAKPEDLFETIDIREGNDFHLNRSVVSLVTNPRQLVFYYRSCKKANSYFIEKPNHQQYQSFLLLNLDEFESPPQRLRLGSSFANFKLLRVLAFESIHHRRQSVLGTNFGTNVERVLGSRVYLRYLSLRDSNLETSLDMHKLVLLQTLDLNIACLKAVSSDASDKLEHLHQLYLPTWCETLDNFNTLWCEIKDLPKLSSLRRLKLRAMDDYDELKEMFKYLSGIVLLSNLCLQYLAHQINIYDQGFKNDKLPELIRQLFWNHKLNLQELSIGGKLPGLFESFEQQQQLNHTHIDVSLIRIIKLTLRFSYLEEDPMTVLEKIPTLRDLHLGVDAYKGKEMVCTAMGFPKLTRLYLQDVDNLKKWRVGEGSMPILQHLQIEKCVKLKS